ncbi:MAG: hypothetical protein N3A54_06190 [Patescibacteria group bacterium]|nr:hypothetical protein [Patescibacteria group bacterium]
MDKQMKENIESPVSITFDELLDMYSNTYKMIYKSGRFLVETHLIDKTQIDIKNVFIEIAKAKGNEKRVAALNEILNKLLKNSTQPTAIFFLGRVFDYELKICVTSFTAYFYGFCNENGEYPFSTVEDVNETNTKVNFMVSYESSSATERYGEYKNSYKEEVENAVMEVLGKAIYSFLDLNKFHKWHYDVTGNLFFEFSKNKESKELENKTPELESIMVYNPKNKNIIH